MKRREKWKKKTSEAFKNKQKGRVRSERKRKMTKRKGEEKAAETYTTN